MKSEKFAKEAFSLGINYLGVCCGANPMLIREVARSVGLKYQLANIRKICLLICYLEHIKEFQSIKETIKTKLKYVIIY